MGQRSASQLEMFGVEDVGNVLAPSARPEPPEFAPFPEALLKRLNAILRLMQAAERMPWPAAEARRKVELFLSAVDRLPPDRRGSLKKHLQAEIARLERAA